MTPVAVDSYHPTLPRPHERQRDQWGMGLFIATEAMLFSMLFFAYFYLASISKQWPPHEAPSVKLALVLLTILLVSSVTAHLGQRGIRQGNRAALNLWLALTLALGIAFMIVQYFEYRHHLQTLTPQTNAYGSVFYTIVSFHAAHVLLGFLMLSHTLARSLAGHFDASHHVAVKNVVWYWHFVDVIWVLVIAILYIAPQWHGDAA